MTTKEILIAARAKIEREENWTRGAYARDWAGGVRLPQSEAAVCFCALGAVRSVQCHYEEGDRAIFALRHEISGTPVSDFNDNPATTHADILALFDRAIRKAGEL